jgi:hypothetical protein
MSIFYPNGSYVDSEGFADQETQNVWSDKVVVDTDDLSDVTSVRETRGPSTKSIYATNVPGWGKIEPHDFFKDTHVPFPVPFAQFIMDYVVGTDGADPATPGQVTFDVEDYKEAFQFAEFGRAMADQGFEITVEPAA